MVLELKGWKFVSFVGVFVGAFGLALYPIIIAPILDPTPYKKAQARTRVGIKQEDVQPGDMKVWTDPFERKKPEK